MATEKIRLFAAVHADVLHPKTRHVVGLPYELRANGDGAEQLPSPDVLVIAQEGDGSIFLYRMTRNGGAAGDTWHQSVDDAKYQAEYEYGEVLGEWQAIPEAVADARDFAVESIGKKTG